MFNKKILVLGPEIEDTNSIVTSMADNDNTINHGLVVDPTFVPTEAGYYHTTVVDLKPGEIVEASDYYDIIQLTHHEKSEYPHFKSFMITATVFLELEKLGKNIKYKDNKSANIFLYWYHFLRENKSFCFHPFMALINQDDYAIVCPKSNNPVTQLDKLIDWSNDPNFGKIRANMLAGELNIGHCDDCYKREAEGQESTRQFETLEWAEKLGFTSVDDFVNVKYPLFYEVRPSNFCNIMCRTCDDMRSSLIEKERQRVDIPITPFKLVDIPTDKIHLESAKRIYYAGGEPTIMPEFLEFLERCIRVGRTDFELQIGTNGMKFSNKLMDLLDHFSDVCFSISYDGYKKINDYIRWGSKFDKIVKNSHLALSRGHKISLQTVYSMYSISRMHEVYEFYDREFPGIGALIQVGVGYGDIFMPYNHPCPELVVESMKRCQQTNVYHMIGRSVKSQVDLMIDFYSDPTYTVNLDLLKKFYDYNHKLDVARNSKLGDYIPELEEARKKYFG